MKIDSLQFLISINNLKERLTIVMQCEFNTVCSEKQTWLYNNIHITVWIKFNTVYYSSVNSDKSVYYYHCRKSRNTRPHDLIPKSTEIYSNPYLNWPILYFIWWNKYDQEYLLKPTHFWLIKCTSLDWRANQWSQHISELRVALLPLHHGNRCSYFITIVNVKWLHLRNTPW